MQLDIHIQRLFWVKISFSKPTNHISLDPFLWFQRNIHKNNVFQYNAQNISNLDQLHLHIGFNLGSKEPDKTGHGKSPYTFPQVSFKPIFDIYRREVSSLSVSQKPLELILSSMKWNKVDPLFLHAAWLFEWDLMAPKASKSTSNSSYLSIKNGKSIKCSHPTICPIWSIVSEHCTKTCLPLDWYFLNSI